MLRTGGITARLRRHGTGERPEHEHAIGSKRLRQREDERCVHVTIGRGVRYFGEGLLALWYGQWALDLLNEHGRAVSLSLAAIIALLGFAYIWWTRRRSDIDATAGSSV